MKTLSDIAETFWFFRCVNLFYFANCSRVLAADVCCSPSGNDLARVLRWGAGYSGEDPHHILVSVDEADEVLMDRWTILLDAQDLSEDSKDNNFLEPPKVWSTSPAEMCLMVQIWFFSK